MVPTTPVLRAIAEMFEASGHQLWLVGGCVRDTLLGIEPKDVDLATSATPDEQIAIYEANGVRHEPTGLQHGTITVIREGEIYEITTFRTDVETDGRHATVAYTRDLLVDLERRDLTMNAIAMSFDGEIVDPFDGRSDLERRRIRFVGDPVLRIREDYLRILRWFRFLGRFAPEAGPVYDPVGYDAIRQEAAGLARISVERIWSEMSRILVGPHPVAIMRMIHDSGVATAIGLPRGDEARLAIAQAHAMDPAAALGGYLADAGDPEAAGRTAIRWKLSNDERRRARFVAERLVAGSYGVDAARLDLVDRAEPQLVADVLRLAGRDDDARMIADWPVPVFPLAGRDLVSAGMRQSPAIGARLKRMREEWIASGYSLTGDQLVERVPA